MLSTILCVILLETENRVPDDKLLASPMVTLHENPLENNAEDDIWDVGNELHSRICKNKKLMN
jgi:hypothetical protein